MKNLFYLLFLTLIISFIIVNIQEKDQKVIKFFPLDETKSFEESKTELKLLTQTDEDSYKIGWNMYSTMDKPVYLRQDVSLLFVDGKLKGILNQWKEEASTLKQETIFNGEDSSHYEAISFHHGEIHYPDDLIKSMQLMTHDHLYIIDSPHSALESFKEPIEQNEKEWKKTLDNTKYQHLNYYWTQLMQHYDLNKTDYLEIPLTELWKFNEKAFPTLTVEQTQQVVGQLWEGIYKNYITGIKTQDDPNGKPLNTYMPLILVDKKGQYLFVLFEDHQGQKHRLIQRIPDFS
ncbi:hypothetical protein HNQ94_002747 [Salirhabdus euzebyi]|uniref:Uncharacterized protein n=1 Tax=Salirhabdus euzebyi TaxID=394506 RepID=A0A841Q7K6_9BACI|nr:hypothetical protein [Salirhabdus euzebyi]MBB6454272.1 hypothetical protein [Salirhabdus euzebyi]